MASTPSDGGLNVIALVSGGKDSFFSALHCLHNGHRLVALANLYPVKPKPDKSLAPAAPGQARQRRSSPGPRDPDAVTGHQRECGAVTEVDDDEDGDADEDQETDLNSFMYQTIGHQVIPLYADATGIPLYRRPIVGGAVQMGLDYSSSDHQPGTGDKEDETESMVPLLQSIKAAHPEANALSAGAILSTYQRTRVESVALRLGLTPLAFLWKYPVLPPPSSPPSAPMAPQTFLSTRSSAGKDEAQLLTDMAVAGLDAHIVKVASGGLDESFLWESVLSAKGIARVKRAMSRFGVAETGAVLGEGGEFETLVVDGPKRLFKKRIVVSVEDTAIVREGGGCAWLRIRRAMVEKKPGQGAEGDELTIRTPMLLDDKYQAVLRSLRLSGLPGSEGRDSCQPLEAAAKDNFFETGMTAASTSIQNWAAIFGPGSATSVEHETSILMDHIRDLLQRQCLSPDAILNTTIILRHMSDFATVNKIYGTLFTAPNPPSRVCISCGDLLPAGNNIAIYLTVHSGLGSGDRQGLHVQSRSYWAPANIGPYSQAIALPVSRLFPGREDATPAGPKVVYIAGQIPLIPATMELPSGPDSLEMSLVLSLQHLWRIGIEMGVQWWTSAAVFFPRDTASSFPTAKEKADLAWRTWKNAHEWSSPTEDGEDDECGPDAWDRKYNATYRSYALDDGTKGEPHLPDWSALYHGERPVPFFFAVEVEGLPQAADAEWHGHAGLSKVSPSTVSVFSETCVGDGASVEINHCIQKSESGLCLHSVAAVELGSGVLSGNDNLDFDKQLREMSELMGSSLAKLAYPTDPESAAAQAPYLVYVDTLVFDCDQIGHASRRGLATIPCTSTWSSRGTRYAMVALYRTVFTSKQSLASTL